MLWAVTGGLLGTDGTRDPTTLKAYFRVVVLPIDIEEVFGSEGDCGDKRPRDEATKTVERETPKD